MFARERDDVTSVSWIIENDRKICPAVLAMEVCNGFARPAVLSVLHFPDINAIDWIIIMPCKCIGQHG
jgi:hypothetical protein